MWCLLFGAVVFVPEVPSVSVVAFYSRRLLYFCCVCF